MAYENIESSWQANRKEVDELLETLTYTTEVDWDEVDEDEFHVIQYTGGFYEILDSRNVHLYASGELTD